MRMIIPLIFANREFHRECQYQTGIGYILVLLGFGIRIHLRIHKF